MEQAWSGWNQNFGPNPQHGPDVGPEPNAGLLGEPEGWQEMPSGDEGRSGARQIFEELGSADGASSRLTLHYHRHPHPHWSTSSLSHLGKRDIHVLVLDLGFIVC